MKHSPHATFTLSPVRRVAAFFAFSVVLALTSCGEEGRCVSDAISDQASAFEEMAGALTSVSDGGDPVEAAKTISAAAMKLKLAKRELAGFSAESKAELIQASEPLAEANQSFFKALETYQRSGNATAGIQKALDSIHDPAPMKGEGSPQ